MSKNTKRTLLGFAVAIAALLLIAYLPAETEAMSRAAWQYLGCFVFMLVLIISRAIPDWAAVLCTMAVLVALKVATVAEVTSNFASSTVWLCIGVFIMSIGINNSGFMKRLALWVLTRFPGTYAGQVTAMLLSGVIMSPIIPSSTAKTSMMAPFVNQVCEASGAERNSKQSLGLWFANFMGTNQLGMAFVSGSVYVALMLGFVGESVSWGQWFVRACVWYVVCIVLVYVFCLVFCKPTDTQKAANVEFIKDSYKALGKLSTKEKQGIIIVLVALILWLTQSTHKIDAGMVAILADVAFIACGLITPPEVGAKGMWRRSLRCRPYGIPRREHLARRHPRPHPRSHHEQPLDIHPLPVHHHLSPAFRYRFPVLLHGSHDRDLRLVARGSRHQHFRTRIYLLGFRYLLERCLPEPRIRRPYQDVRSFPRLCNRIQGLLRILHHQPHCNDLQCASLDGTGPSVIEHVRLRVHSR